MEAAFVKAEGKLAKLHILYYPLHSGCSHRKVHSSTSYTYGLLWKVSSSVDLLVVVVTRLRLIDGTGRLVDSDFSRFRRRAD